MSLKGWIWGYSNLFLNKSHKTSERASYRDVFFLLARPHQRHIAGQLRGSRVTVFGGFIRLLCNIKTDYVSTCWWRWTTERAGSDDSLYLSRVNGWQRSDHQTSCPSFKAATQKWKEMEKNQQKGFWFPWTVIKTLLWWGQKGSELFSPAERTSKLKVQSAVWSQSVD